MYIKSVLLSLVLWEKDTYMNVMLDDFLKGSVKLKH